MMRAKNKSTAPSLTFPFAIKLNKAGKKEEKVDMRQGGSRIKQIQEIWGLKWAL